MAKKARKASKAKAKKRSAAKRPARRAAKAAAPSIDAVARKIVSATQKPDFPFMTLYHPDATSAEAAGPPVRGHAGLEEKNRRWGQMQRSSKWKARNVWTGKNTVCIEWNAEVEMRDGRRVALHEIAVHEIKNGKIQAERYYYDPSALVQQAAASAPAASASDDEPVLTGADLG